MKSATKSLNKTAIADAVAGKTDLKRKDCVSVLNTLADVVRAEVKKTGKMILPGIVMVKTRVKPATKAGKREIFGEVRMVKAKRRQDDRQGVPSGRVEEGGLRRGLSG